MKLLAFALFLLTAPVSVTGGFGPWTFGMTSAQIRAVTNHGPYHAFTNGDLETYNATLCGKKENVQFYLKDNQLLRIVVVTYEGKSIEQATAAWAWTYNCLQKLHGALDTPGLKGDDLRALATEAKGLVANGIKVQMAPHTQSNDRFVFSSFRKEQTKDLVFYRVWINYDRPSS